MPFGLLSQVCHTTCSSSSFLTAAPVSFTPLHSSAPHFRSIAPCSQLNICSRALHPAALLKSFLGGMQNPFRRPDHNSLGSITLVRRSFISVRFSPPAANFLCARRQPHLGCVHLAAAIAHSSLISQSIAKVHLHSSATFVPCGKFTPVASYVAAIAFLRQAFLAAPLWGLAVRLRSFVPHSLRRPPNGSPSLQPRQVCGAAMLLFCRRRFYRNA